MKNFFDWIRRSQIMRSDQRWIGGVCAGIAQRLGWDVALVRVIMVLLTIVGAGLFVYPLAWLLLPNTNGEILAEALFEGRSTPGESVAALIFLVIGALSTAFTFWGLLTVALLFVLIGSAEKQATNPAGWQKNSFANSYGGPRQNQQNQPYAGQPYAGQQYQTPQNDDARFRAPGSPVNPAYMAAAQGDNPAAQAQAAQSQPQASAQPQSNPYAYPQSSAYYVPPVQHVQREQVIRTRKSAGPVVRLLVWAGIFLSAGLTYLSGILMHLGAADFVGWARLGMMWGVGVTIVLCLLTLVLALAGRKTAGYMWLTAIGVIGCLILSTGGVAYNNFHVISYSANQAVSGNSRITHEYSVSDGTTIKADKKLISDLQEGVAFTSSDKFTTAQVTVDLSNWSDVMGSHEWTKSDGTTQTSSCPTGDFTMALTSVNLTLIVPEGCTYGRSTMGGFGAFDTQTDWAAPIENELNHKYAEKFRAALRDMRQKEDSLNADSSEDSDDYEFLDDNDDADWYDAWLRFGDYGDQLTSTTSSLNNLGDEYMNELSNRLEKDIELRINLMTSFGRLKVQEA